MPQENPNIAAVIGDPISHSLSPKLYNYWFQKYKILGHYIPLHIVQEDIKEALKILPKIGFAGLNVTIPHKEYILSLVDQVSDRAMATGAANVLTFLRDGTIHADNTDGIGFLSHMTQTIPSWKNHTDTILILGAGGAAKAVVSALMLDNISQNIIITNRNPERAVALKNQFNSKSIKIRDWHDAPSVIEHANLIINTSPMGMEGYPGFSIDLSRLSPPTIVMDIVYTPLETELLRRARAKGCETVDGLGMLFHQAVPAFKRWFGYQPCVDQNLYQAILSR